MRGVKRVYRSGIQNQNPKIIKITGTETHGSTSKIIPLDNLNDKLEGVTLEGFTLEGFTFTNATIVRSELHLLYSNTQSKSKFKSIKFKFDNSLKQSVIEALKLDDAGREKISLAEAAEKQRLEDQEKSRKQQEIEDQRIEEIEEQRLKQREGEESAPKTRNVLHAQSNHGGMPEERVRALERPHWIAPKKRRRRP